MFNLQIKYHSSGLLEATYFPNTYYSLQSKKPRSYIDTPFGKGYVCNSLLNEDGTLNRVRYEESKRCSLARTKRRVNEIIHSFKPSYFFTLTFSPEFCNRYDYCECIKLLRLYMKNYLRLVPYIFIPEYHKDGAIHFHGIVGEYSSSLVVKNKYGYLSVKDWDYGFSNASEVKDVNRLQSYVLKYITKDLIDSPFRHRYFFNRAFNTHPVKQNIAVDPSILKFIERKFSIYYCKKSVLPCIKFRIDDVDSFLFDILPYIYSSDFDLSEILSDFMIFENGYNVECALTERRCHLHEEFSESYQRFSY